MQSTDRKVASSGDRRSGSSDQALVQRVKQGDRSAFDLLVAKYQHKILNLIMRYVKDPSEAMDVAQEAFLKAYRAVPSFRGDSAFYTWLYRIAINTAKNHLVAAKRRPASLGFDLSDSEAFEPFAVLRDMDSPEHLALTDEIGEVINQAVEALPVELRTAILLREIEGMSYEEIAQTMECPVGTVRSRIFRAREAIDKKLKPLM
ncbi:MAG TPA: RNA polymerase sigma factor RpoE [Gammaproteobacteria bacterium]|jgi:RNA polymerase sigma-70 factor (ECF subfamily)